jgi:hypothetical protein
MKRRSFLKLIPALAAVGTTGRASSAAYDGPCLLLLNAVGGWDPTLLCDPKPGGVINRAYGSTIATVGAFRLAPVQFKTLSGVVLAKPEDFFRTHGDRLCVVNGIDTSTNNHTIGVRLMDSGTSEHTLPNIAALLGAHAESAFAMPCPYLTDAYGYSAALDATSVTYPRVDLLRALVNSTDYRPEYGSDPLGAALRARMRQLPQDLLPPAGGDRVAVEAYLRAKRNAENLRSLYEALPKHAVTVADACPDIRGGDAPLEAILQKIEFALTAFSVGASAGASLGLAEFDTHANHDARQGESMGRLLRALDYAIVRSRALGLGARLTVGVVSEFGRTPFYNQEGGKDHWNATSAVFYGPAIAGGRVLGRTNQQKCAPVALADPAREATDGVIIQPVTVHAELRRVLGIAGGGADRRYPLAGAQAMRLFG